MPHIDAPVPPFHSHIFLRPFYLKRPVKAGGYLKQGMRALFLRIGPLDRYYEPDMHSDLQGRHSRTLSPSAVHMVPLPASLTL